MGIYPNIILSSDGQYRIYAVSGAAFTLCTHSDISRLAISNLNLTLQLAVSMNSWHGLEMSLIGGGSPVPDFTDGSYH